MNEIADSFSDRASFLIVYISEAHATDVWPLGNTVCVNDHKTIEERIQVANTHIIENRKCKIPMLVDSIENEFERFFHGWPERYFILQGDNLAYVAQPSKNDQGFFIDEVFASLNELLPV